MTTGRFDSLLRGFTTSSRRRISRAIAGAALGSLASQLVLDETGARKKRKKKKKKPGCPSCGPACCGAGSECVSSWDASAEQCCATALVCRGSRTGCCSSGLTCVENVDPPAGTPTHACVT